MCLIWLYYIIKIYEKYEFELFIKCMIGIIIFVVLIMNVKISF